VAKSIDKLTAGAYLKAMKKTGRVVYPTDLDKTLKDAFKRAGKGKIVPGREVWNIRSGDTIKTIVTSPSSTAAMDEAVIIYDTALKSLANR
jgi:hypothetical protein